MTWNPVDLTQGNQSEKFQMSMQGEFGGTCEEMMSKLAAKE